MLLYRNCAGDANFPSLTKLRLIPCERVDYYPLDIRRKAARLVLEIAFLVYLNQFKTLADLSNALLSIRGTYKCSYLDFMK